MKRIFLTLAIAFSIVAVQSCGGGAKNDSKETADSINEEKAPENMDDDQVAATPLSVSEEDAKFVTEAANGGMAEVELGQLAQQKAQHADVKAFGEMMIKDHSKANDELTALAQAKNITVPATVGAEQQKVKDDLAKKTGRDFDKAYIDEMVKDHEKDVKLFEDASKNLKDAELKAFVDKTLPTLRTHLEHSKSVKDKLK
ncbi:MAG: outer membrane protein-like protein [Sphingobacterium sp.]|jgi:putative membrane protein|nr:outer membrane protein-like protein [Sphingobacterium sp.]